MTEYFIGETFIDAYPPEAAGWCNAHNAHIQEIEKIGEKRQFRIDANPEPTPYESATARITELKNYLSDTDYIPLKIFEGRATREEYAPMLEKREAWRQEIRELEKINA